VAMVRKRRVRYAWLRIKDDILDEIFEGKYHPGDRIATVAELATRHSVSTTTVRQAIDELASEGVLEVRQGSGTIVAPPKLDYNPLRGFAEQAVEFGKVPQTRIYLTQWTQKHGEAMRYLGLRKGQRIWEVTRLHYLDDEPSIIEVTLFPRDLANRFMGDSRVLESMFGVLRAKLGYDHWDVDVVAVKVTTERAFSDLLSIPRRTIFYNLQRVISVDGKPLFLSILVLRSDKFQLRFETHTNGED
jgi:DNA-binding GntR family transcriptional regulator